MTSEQIEALSALSIPERKINQATVEHYKVKCEVSETNGEITAHYYPVIKDGRVSGYKKRTLPKEFSSIGDAKGAVELFGQSVCPKSGKRLLIVGGELDALAGYQMLKERYPQYNHAVVSLPKGENPSSIKDNLKFINSFEEVIIYTDMDEPGRKAADNIAKLIGPKAKIMKTTEKDASDMLVKGKKQEFISAFYDAEARKPEGIIAGKDITLEEIKKVQVVGYSLPYPQLNRMLGGLRKGELTTLTAGSGIGKSTLARELAYHLRKEHDLTIGNIFLEETLAKTVQGYVALDNNVPLTSLRKRSDILSDSQWEESYASLIASKWFALSHFGSLPTEDLMDKMRYLAYGEHCDFIILDHLSLVFSGQHNDNERLAIDNALTELAAFCNESGVGVLTVVHLSRNKQKTSFNEGGQISLTDLRGSAALEQLSFNVIGLERSQQADTEEEKNTSRIRLLKCRETGFTGEADECIYNFDTGRLQPKVFTLSGEY